MFSPVWKSSYKSTLLTLTNSDSSMFNAAAILSNVSIDGELVPRSMPLRHFYSSQTFLQVFLVKVYV